MDSRKLKTFKSKVLCLGFLLAICLLLTYYSYYILKSDLVFTHFFYIPIILAGLWWGRTGIFVSFFLAIMLVASHILISPDVPVVACALRACMFVIVGSVVAVLNEKKHLFMDKLQTETALRKTEMKNQALLNAIPDLVFQISREGIFMDFKTGKDIDLYVPPGEFLGKKIYDVLPPDIARQGMLLLERTLQTGKTQELEYQLPVEGIIHHYEGLMATFTKDEVILTVRDVTRRKYMEEALKKSERELTLRNRIAGIFLTSPDKGMFRKVLQLILESMESRYGMFGYIDEHGALTVPSMTRDIWELCQVPDKTTVFPRQTWGGIWGRALVEKISLYANEGLCVPEGHISLTRVLVVPIIYAESVIGLLVIGNKQTDYGEQDREFMEDLASSIAPILNARLQRDKQMKERMHAEEALKKSNQELKDTQVQLLRAGKLTAMGEMAAGIVHELSQPLLGISGFASAMLEDMKHDGLTRAVSDLEVILQQIDHMTTIVDTVRNFAHESKTEKKPININQTIENAMILFSQQLRVHNIAVEMNLAPDLPPVMGNSNQMQQVLINLITNARDAMEAKGGKGRLIIATEQTDSGIHIEVEDTGIGADAETVRMMFEPFFTTRTKGIGLGLAIVSRIIDDHQGTINVQCEEGKGCKFTIHLPAGVKEGR